MFSELREHNYTIYIPEFRVLCVVNLWLLHNSDTCHYRKGVMGLHNS